MYYDDIYLCLGENSAFILRGILPCANAVFYVVSIPYIIGQKRLRQNIIKVLIYFIGLLLLALLFIGSILQKFTFTYSIHFTFCYLFTCNKGLKHSFYFIPFLVSYLYLHISPSTSLSLKILFSQSILGSLLRYHCLYVLLSLALI